MAAQAILNHQIWRWFSLGEKASSAVHNASSSVSPSLNIPAASTAAAISPSLGATSTSSGYWASATDAAWSKLQLPSRFKFNLDFWNSEVPARAGLGEAQRGEENWAQYPSLGTFVTSWYCLTLVIIAFVVNRIHHVVPTARRRDFRLERGTHIALRLPALLLVGKSLYLVLSKSAYNSTDDSVWTWLGRKLLKEASDFSDSAVMWNVFISLSVSCLAEAFVRALNNDPRHHPSFNLLSVSYLLHFHSTPESRPYLKPTPLVYLLIGLTLAEVFALQFIDTFKLRIRLVVTAFFALFGQTALVYCLWKVSHSDLDPMSLNALLPALRHLTRLSELLFFGVSVITIAIHALVQLIVDRRLTTEIFGPTSRLPTWNDDFSLAVIVYGAACLETTHSSGFSNEVAPVVATGRSGGPAPFIELGRFAPSTTPDGFVIMADAQRAFPEGHLRGFQTEVKDIRATAMHPEQAPDEMSRTSSLMREAGRFSRALLNILLDIIRFGGLTISRRCKPLARRASGDGRIARALRFVGIMHPAELRRAIKAREAERARQSMPTADEDDSDAEDPDFQPRQTDESSDSESSDSSELAGEDADSDQDEDAAGSREDSFTLYTDFMEEQDAQPEELNQVMLAHMTSSPDRRLTRRQFQQLSNGSSFGAAGAHARQLHSDITMSENLETQLVCIVCRADARCIICWPCRCLALCESCKDVLSSSRHAGNSCPSCRQTVQGFSRVFVA